MKGKLILIYLTGDCHGDFTKIFDLKDKLNKNDYIIVTGDFGYWSYKQKNLFNKLKELPFTILFVDGNHSNFDMLNDLPIEKWNTGYVHFIRDNIIHLMRGQIFNIENKTFFTFGGAESIDKIWRVEGKSWWKEELPNDWEIQIALNNLELINNKVNYIITHDCSKSILRQININFKTSIVNSFFEMLEDIKFDKWFFGHHHINREIDDKHICLYDNIIKLF
jgi:hypothetical protein